MSKKTISMFDRVRIHTTPITKESKVAGLIGEVYGITTPSKNNINVEIIGELREDCAYNVYFKETNENLWFSPNLVDFLDHNAGFEINIGGVKATRLETGEWQEQSKTKRKFKDDLEIFQAAQENKKTISEEKGIWTWLRKIFLSN